MLTCSLQVYKCLYVHVNTHMHVFTPHACAPPPRLLKDWEKPEVRHGLGEERLLSHVDSNPSVWMAMI